jgi:branched-subunit amino acid transport protein
MTIGTTSLVVAIVVLATGTYGLRVAGTTLQSRLTLSARTQRAMTAASVIMLVALIATASLLDGHAFAGWARPAGVAVGGLLAWRRAPLVAVVLAAAGVTAGLRLFGVR